MLYQRLADWQRYDEDIDLGLKIRKAGWRIVFKYDAAVYHYFMERNQNWITGSMGFRFGRNRAILIVRNYGFSLRLILFLRPFQNLCRKRLEKVAIKREIPN